MPIYIDADGQDREINSIVSGRIFQTENAMVCRLKAKQGEAIFPHSHDSDQITVILDGCLEWKIEGEKACLVRAGDVMVMPSGIRHGGQVVEDAQYINVFSPPNHDFGWDKLNSD